MNPSDRPRPELAEGLESLRLPRITVTREQPNVAGSKGLGIDAFGVDTVDKLIEAFEVRERDFSA
jgi:hypothetical protein